MSPIKPLVASPEFSHVATLTSSSLQQDGKRILEMLENESVPAGGYKYAEERVPVFGPLM